MGYYPSLDAQKGRAEERYEFWIRRHDEYDE
jgi:predicted dithiol-disulfide oxidoreductase (DUF899 family)